MQFVIRKGDYWLQDENGWGQKGCATRFPTRRKAEHAAKKLDPVTIEEDLEEPIHR